jgi:AcrR family transcriptional regulator
MKRETKINKENLILVAAETVFGKYGFKNSRMEDIAAQAGITKVTLYSYFKSKENLYMAITYRAVKQLADVCDASIEKNRDKKGIDSVIGIMESFMDFCQSHYFYSEVFLDYFSIIRSTSQAKDEDKLPLAIKESEYFPLIQEIHNKPFKATAKEIQRGIADGSISKNLDPMFATIQGWTTAVGFVKVSAASGDNAMPLFNISMEVLKKKNLEIQRRVLSSY